MKTTRLLKNAKYAAGYGSSFRRFKKSVRASPDKGISRVNARELKRLWHLAKLILSIENSH